MHARYLGNISHLVSAVAGPYLQLPRPPLFRVPWPMALVVSTHGGEVDAANLRTTSMA